MSSLYFHIPFCERKCIYCDFYSIETLSPIEEFLSALKIEIALQEQFHGEKFETIFFGGGTPSLLSPPQLENIFNLIYKHFSISRNAEITVECNPETVDKEKLTAYRSLGVNRLSFGVQSFFEDDLQFLSRIHNSQKAKEAIRLAHKADFENVNLDLIFALPNQTQERWKQNLEQAIELEPAHISAYSLIVEQNTPLNRLVSTNQVTMLSNETDATMYEMTMEFLEKKGFEHYEVSNYGKKNFHCQHNKNYWNHTNYLSFGPSAHSFWQNGISKRWWNIANLSTYTQKLFDNQLPIAGEETLSAEQLFEETIMLGLRSEGFDLEKVKSNFGIDFLTQHYELIPELLSNDFIFFEKNILRLTRKGFLLCEEIVQRLLSKVTA
ncbi:MAG: radical SAM family heme chaperone HemW [Ignavibacteriales bacterium]|nr:radical SAM family heme chaperone HemW [Ignavibacteriales bacterium]